MKSRVQNFSLNSEQLTHDGTHREAGAAAAARGPLQAGWSKPQRQSRSRCCRLHITENFMGQTSSAPQPDETPSEPTDPRILALLDELKALPFTELKRRVIAAGLDSNVAFECGTKLELIHMAKSTPEILGTLLLALERSTSETTDDEALPAYCLHLLEDQNFDDAAAALPPSEPAETTPSPPTDSPTPGQSHNQRSPLEREHAIESSRARSLERSAMRQVGALEDRALREAAAAVVVSAGPTPPLPGYHTPTVSDEQLELDIALRRPWAPTPSDRLKMLQQSEGADWGWARARAQ